MFLDRASERSGLLGPLGASWSENSKSTTPHTDLASPSLSRPSPQANSACPGLPHRPDRPDLSRQAARPQAIVDPGRLPDPRSYRYLQYLRTSTLYVQILRSRIRSLFTVLAHLHSIRPDPQIQQIRLLLMQIRPSSCRSGLPHAASAFHGPSTVLMQIRPSVAPASVLTQIRPSSRRFGFLWP